MGYLRCPLKAEALSNLSWTSRDPLGPGRLHWAVLSEQIGLGKGFPASPARVPFHLPSSDRKRIQSVRPGAAARPTATATLPVYRFPTLWSHPHSSLKRWLGITRFYREDSKAQERGLADHVAFRSLAETVLRPQRPTGDCQSHSELVQLASGEMEAQRGEVTGPRAHS